jgi:chemotaxis family two-component system response regulator PixG
VNHPTVVRIQEFTPDKQVRFFNALKHPRFSGQLTLTDGAGRQWQFYLYFGRILYATGGIHPVRRWLRNIAAYCPQLPKRLADLRQLVATVTEDDLEPCWEYQLLEAWIAQDLITREQAIQVVRTIVVEVLFDLAQATNLAYTVISQENPLPQQLVLIDSSQAITDAQQLWAMWQSAKVADRSPNRAPTIRQPAELKAHTSESTYRTLTTLLDGQHTLRDLAVRMKRSVVDVARSLLPFFESGWIELVDVNDLPPLVQIANPVTLPTLGNQGQGALVACVDDSPLICQTVEGIVRRAGYRFVGITDPLRAIATLLTQKPNLICLDLVMPNTSGYEICSQLRKLTLFRDTPIVILTGKDGIVDRVKAKLVGASGYLSKPIDKTLLLNEIQKQLSERAVKKAE